jgi:hypothetical protein
MVVETLGALIKLNLIYKLDKLNKGIIIKLFNTTEYALLDQLCHIECQQLY